MVKIISIRLERPLIQTLSMVEKTWHTDRSKTIRRLLNTALQEWKKDQAIEKVRQHKISIGKAAEDGHIPVWEMLDLLKQNNIDWAGYSEKDLKKDFS